MVFSGELVIADHGPAFIGAIRRQAGRVVCVVAPIVMSEDGDDRAAFVELARREGVDCGGCDGCPLASAG